MVKYWFNFDLPSKMGEIAAPSRPCSTVVSSLLWALVFERGCSICPSWIHWFLCLHNISVRPRYYFCDCKKNRKKLRGNSPMPTVCNTISWSNNLILTKVFVSDKLFSNGQKMEISSELNTAHRREKHVFTHSFLFVCILSLSNSYLLLRNDPIYKSN